MAYRNGISRNVLRSKVSICLPDSGSTLTKSALKSVARCVDNNTCCGEIGVLETTEGIVISAYRPKALKCGSGAFSTHWFPTESVWSPGGRLFAYGFAMIYCFLGIAIIADRFMVAIEVITSAEVSKTVTLPNGEKTTVTFLRWNETVANLTLMALGSSAPEILLAIGETVGQLGQTDQQMGWVQQPLLGPQLSIFLQLVLFALRFQMARCAALMTLEYSTLQLSSVCLLMFGCILA